MARRDQDSLAAILLTTRLVDAPAGALSATEFAELRSVVPEPGALLGRDIAETKELVGDSSLDADRIVALLDRATAVALEVEQLESSGIRVVTVFDDGYPYLLVARLGAKAPAVLHVVGDPALMSLDLLGIVGSRDVDDHGGAAAREAARAAVEHGWGVVSGGARGVDRLAMNAATDAGGCAVGMLADSLAKVVQEPELRRLVADGVACLATPYAPTMRFTPANAMARNKLIYGLARRTLVVASDHDKGGTWAGAREALGKTLHLPVDVWMGLGAGPGNEALVARGGRAITTVSEVFDEPDVPIPEPDDAEQLNLGV